MYSPCDRAQATVALAQSLVLALSIHELCPQVNTAGVVLSRLGSAYACRYLQGPAGDILPRARVFLGEGQKQARYRTDQVSLSPLA